MNYQNKTILITGAYRGIGKSIVDFFSKCQCNFIITYHNHKDETYDLKREMENKYKVNIDCIYLDLQDEVSIKNVYNYVKGNYQKIDILINNASLSMDNFIMDKTKKEFMNVLEVNVVGTFLMMKYFDELINGYIFNISSTDGIDTGSIYSIDYNVSKAGINSLTKTFSLYSKNKIISICPNWVDTESTNEIDKNYLDSELKRIKQEKLINASLIPKVINDSIINNIESGSIIRIEGECDVRRID